MCFSWVSGQGCYLGAQVSGVGFSSRISSQQEYLWVVFRQGFLVFLGSWNFKGLEWEEQSGVLSGLRGFMD